MNIDGYALVTGAGSGIGRDCALAYAIEGAAGVVFADLNISAAATAMEESKALATNPSYRTLSLSVNVADEESVEDMVSQTLTAFGRIDYCVNSAGVGVQDPQNITTASLPDFDRFLDVNIRGTLLCVRAVSREMRKQPPQIIPSREPGKTSRSCGRGVIINLGSSNSYVATPNIVQYTASKHAVLGITRNAALDLAHDEVRVNALCPSWVETPMIERAVAGDPGLAHLMQRVVPLGRLATKEEISDVLMFMSSPRASYVTGAGWMVDGGATLQLQT
ncbi:3-oxoacyl-reductase [Aspergillus aurantiobrunneus]